MVKYCVAALLATLAWLMPAAAWATPPLLAQTTAAEVAKAPLSADELSTFAQVYQEVQTLRIGAEREMAKAVEDTGLTIDRFNAIAETQLSANTDDPDSPDAIARIAKKAKISKQENKQFEAAVERIIAIRQSTEGEMETVIEAQGMSIDSFNSILEQSASDTALQRQISDEIVKQTLATAESAS